MKFVLTLFFTAFLLIPQSHATGTLYCATADQSIEFYGSTGRVPGNPLINGILVNTEEATTEFTNSQVVGYWNMGEDLMLALTDVEAMELVYVIKAKYIVAPETEPSFVGTVEFANGDIFDVVCEL